MAADTVVAFSIMCAALLPILWSKMTDNELLRRGFLLLSISIMTIGIYIVKSIIPTIYPDVADVFEKVFWVLLLVLGAIILIAVLEFCYGLVEYFKSIYDRSRTKWRGGQRSQSTSQDY